MKLPLRGNEVDFASLDPKDQTSCDSASRRQPLHETVESFHCTGGVLTQFVHGSLRGAAKAATWQSASLCNAFAIFPCNCGAPPHQRPLCVKGAGLALARSGGLFRRRGITKAESDYELSDFWTRSSRILHTLTHSNAAIPPSAGADTSLYTREALVPSNSENAVEHYSLLPRRTDSHTSVRTGSQ